MDHSEDTDGPSGDSPRVLVRQLLLAGSLRVLKHNLKHLGEVLAQMVGCGTLSRNSEFSDTGLAGEYTENPPILRYLDGSAAGRDERLHGGGVIASGKLLLLRLPALHHGDGHQLLVHPRVQIQDLKHLFGCLLFGGEGRVSLLPQELSRPQERLRVLELPSLKEKKHSLKKEERHMIKVHRIVS